MAAEEETGVSRGVSSSGFLGSLMLFGLRSSTVKTRSSRILNCSIAKLISGLDIL